MRCRSVTIKGDTFPYTINEGEESALLARAMELMFILKGDHYSVEDILTMESGHNGMHIYGFISIAKEWYVSRDSVTFGNWERVH